MNYLKTEGIVIKHYPIAESDRMFTVYTRDYGKINVFAKSVRKPQAKLASMDYFTCLAMQLYWPKNREYGRLVGGKFLHSCPELRKDLLRFALAMKYLEIIDFLTPHGEKSQLEFELLDDTLKELEYHNPVKVFYYSLLQQLKLLGYQIHIENCVMCNQEKPEPGQNRQWGFQPEEGGIICDGCISAKNLDIIYIKEKTVVDLQQLQNCLWENVVDCEFNWKEIMFVLEMYLNYHLPRPLKSQKFIDRQKIAVSV